MPDIILDITLHKNDDESFSIKFMETEILTLDKNTSEELLNTIYDGVVRAFYLGMNIGVEAIKNDASECIVRS